MHISANSISGKRETNWHVLTHIVDKSMFADWLTESKVEDYICHQMTFMRLLIC